MLLTGSHSLYKKKREEEKGEGGRVPIEYCSGSIVVGSGVGGLSKTAASNWIVWLFSASKSH